MAFEPPKFLGSADRAKGYSKVIGQFRHYSLIGAIATLFYIGLISLAVDGLGVNSVLATAAITIFIFFFKFWAYVRTRLIHPRILQFVVVNALFSITHAILVVLLIDVVRLSAFLSSVIVTSAVFVVRFAFMKAIRLVRESHDDLTETPSGKILETHKIEPGEVF
jgi:hypothetical protein